MCPHPAWEARAASNRIESKQALQNGKPLVALKYKNVLFSTETGERGLEEKTFEGFGGKTFFEKLQKGEETFCLVNIRGLILTSNIKELKNNADDRNLNV